MTAMVIITLRHKFQRVDVTLAIDEEAIALARFPIINENLNQALVKLSDALRQNSTMSDDEFAVFMSRGNITLRTDLESFLTMMRADEFKSAHAIVQPVALYGFSLEVD
jgi:hypothetical protein